MTFDLPETEEIVRAERGRPRGFINWTPNANSKVLLDQVKSVLVEYRALLPLTARQIFYRLVGTKGYGKTERDYKRLTELLNKARRAQIINFGAIRDDGTTTDRAPGYADEQQIKRVMRQVARRGLNLQVDQPISQLVICEAGGMVPQLSRVAHDFGVDVMSAGGFNSVTDKHDLACDIVRDGRPCLIWHIGDYDPSGVHVFQSLADDVIRFAESYDFDDLSFQRLAVTEGQIREYSLPSAPAKRTDNRAFDGRGTVQAEALPPEALASILDQALTEFFDFDIAEDVKERSADFLDRATPMLDQI